MYNSKILRERETLRQEMAVYFNGFFKGMPVTSQQALVLEYIINEHPGEPVYPKDLKKFLSITGPSVVSLLNGLERSGYIRREQDDGDRRQTRILATEKALEISGDIHRQMELFNEGIFRGISSSDLRTFEKVILKMTDNARG
jgi:DNA-binding MarR family transcriptional regulator